MLLQLLLRLRLLLLLVQQSLLRVEMLLRHVLLLLQPPEWHSLTRSAGMRRLVLQAGVRLRLPPDDVVHLRVTLLPPPPAAGVAQVVLVGNQCSDEHDG